MTELLEKISKLNTTVVAALIAALASLFVALLNFIIQRKTLKIQTDNYRVQTIVNANNAINQKVVSLEKQIEEFYKPFKAYLTESAYLYKIFRAGLPKGFRALIYLIDNDYLFDDNNGNKVKAILDQKNLRILENILQIEDKLYDLIIQKGGIVEDETLYKKYMPNSNITDVFTNFDINQPGNLPQDIGLLNLFMVHRTLMKLAKNGELAKANIDIYKDFVYPRELNLKIDQNIEILYNEIKTLKAALKAVG
jgi:hypothetical protein